MFFLNLYVVKTPPKSDTLEISQIPIAFLVDLEAE